MASLLSRTAWAAQLLYIALLLAKILYAADQDVFCNGDVYGNPISPECFNILAKFPIFDTTVHYFVEQQMRTAPPEAVWKAFKDPRSPSQEQTVVQLPKRLSYGTCNIALFSFISKDRRRMNFSPALAWSEIFTAGLKLDNQCLTNKEGGAIVVNDIRGQPGLSLFMWEDGAPFEFLLNHENILEFPPGMDPTNPEIGPSLLNNATFATGFRGVEDRLTQDESALYL